MKFAIPTVGNKLTPHFGHCEKFAIIEVEDGQIISEYYVTPPMHQPGVYPRFLVKENVNVVITGGIGHKAIQLFTDNKIRVLNGVTEGEPKQLVHKYLEDQLKTGLNLCNH